MAPISVDHLRRLPKVELHCHVEGSARAATVAELAQRDGVDSPFGSSFPPVYQDLAHFLDVFSFACSAFVTTDDFRRLAYESLEDAARAGVRYREMFFSPGYVVRPGVDLGTYWNGLTVGIAEAEHDFGIRCRLILDVDKPAGVAAAVELVAFAASQDRELLIGIGGDSFEKDVDHAALAPAFADAARAGLHRTIHAGEQTVENIAIAVRILGCERVDHATLLLDDPALTREVIEKRIGLTVCPTSTVAIAHLADSIAEHPLLGAGLEGALVTINSDDPSLLGRWVDDEYQAVHEELGWGLEAMEDLSLVSVEASWAPDKAAMRLQFLAEFNRLRQEYGQAPRLG